MKKKKMLHKDAWVSLCSIEDQDEWGPGEYVFAHESRCHGQIVAVLPYRIESGGSISFLLRSEVVPCWGTEPNIVSITGGVEHLTPEACAIEELREEAGLVVKENALLSLGVCRGTKCVDTVYHLFAVDATTLHRNMSLATGDGSYLEKIATCFWSKRVHDAVDPLVHTMVLRLAVLLDS